MNYVLDTDVISQLSKERPHPGAYAWIRDQEDETVFLCAATMFEIRFGVERMPPGKKRDKVGEFVSTAVPRKFPHRIIPIERHVADLAARILARSLRENWGMDSMDAIIGATAMANGMGVATLNRKHFERLGVQLVEF